MARYGKYDATIATDGALLDLLWASVEVTESGCWLHPTPCSSVGYGEFYYKGKSWRAHRLALEIKLGRPIAKGKSANHTCIAQHSCCRPSHLYEGNQTENNKDRDDAGRGNHARGLAAGNASLTDAKAREAIRLYRTGHYSQTEVGDIVGCSHQTVSSIINRRGRWADLKEEGEL
jgi:hypothetical protein